MERFKVHNIEFYRTGECNKCGGCASQCIECPHGVETRDGSKCTIYSNRHLHCEECSVTHGEPIDHQICIDFPNHPWLHVIRRGVCNYTFARIDGESMDDIPFVDGKFKVEK